MDKSTLKKLLAQVTATGIIYLRSTFTGGVTRAMEYELKEPKVFTDGDQYYFIFLSPRQKLETWVEVTEAVKQLEPPTLEEVEL